MAALLLRAAALSLGWQSSGKLERDLELADKSLQEARVYYETLFNERKQEWMPALSLVVGLLQSELIEVRKRTTAPTSATNDKELTSGQELRLFDVRQDKLYSFNSPNDAVIYMGRATECQVRTENDQGVSRVHAILVTCQQLGLRLLLDIGCVNGIAIVAREAEASDVKSSAKRRAMFAFGLDESAVIALTPTTQVVLQPRTCVVCLDKPRATTFSACGHFVACRECALKLTHCPLCRKPGVCARDLQACTVGQ